MSIDIHILVGSVPMTPAFEREKTIYILDRAGTVIDIGEYNTL
jgi:hypothetical protein